MYNLCAFINILFYSFYEQTTDSKHSCVYHLKIHIINMHVIKKIILFYTHILCNRLIQLFAIQLHDFNNPFQITNIILVRMMFIYGIKHN